MAVSDEQDGVSLVAVIRGLVQRIWLSPVCILLSLVVGLLLFSRGQDEYVAEAVLAARSDGGDVNLGSLRALANLSGGALGGEGSRLNEVVFLLKARPAAVAVAAQPGITARLIPDPDSAPLWAKALRGINRGLRSMLGRPVQDLSLVESVQAQLSRRMAVQKTPEGFVVARFSHPDRDLALDVLNLVVGSVLETMQAHQVEEIRQRQEAIRTYLAESRMLESMNVALRLFADQDARLIALTTESNSAARTIVAPFVTDRPVGTRLSVVLVLSVIAGLALYAATVLVLAARDTLRRL
jgi:hypothetical protein